MAVNPFAGGAPLTPASPATPRRRYPRPDVDSLFHALYDAYRHYYHPAVAAILAQVDAKARVRRAMR